MRAVASGDRGSLTPAAVLGLQRTHGNHFVQRHLSRPAAPSVQRSPSVNVTAAASQSVQRSVDSDELQQVFTTSGSAAALEWLRNFQKSDADVETFVNANFKGDDLWFAKNLMAYGPEASWPLNLQIERHMKSFPDSGGKAKVFELLRAANGTQAGNSQMLPSLLKVFGVMSDDLWLAQKLWKLGPESGWPAAAKVELELKGFSGPIKSTEVLKALSTVSDPEFDTLMTNMTQGQTDQFLTNLSAGDTATYGALIEKVKTTRILKTGQSMLGKLKWRGGSGPDESDKYKIKEDTTWGHENNFAKWINGSGKEPGAPDDTMNCWQGVLFMAYKAGVVKKSWLVKIHEDAAKAGEAASSPKVYYNVLEQGMHKGALTAVPFDSGKGVRSAPIPAGNIIFINSLDHVVISKGKTDPNGKHEVLSLWILPAPGEPLGGWTGNEVGVLQDTTLEDVSTGPDKVEYAPAPW